METVAVFGVGLIGGSFALALRQAGFKGAILGVSSPRSIEQALALRVIDAGVDEETAARQADLIYLAQPIHEIIHSIARLDPLVKPDALVTDAGSTKTAVTQQASRYLHRCQFLGGHPLTGKETAGVSSAEPQLFLGHKYVVTPLHPEQLAVTQVRNFLMWLDKIGAVRVVLDPAEHDRTVAHTSHLPQLAATALALALKNSGANLDVFGPGVLDMTRLAMSPFSIWKDILETNSREIRSALSIYIAALQHLTDAVGSEDMRDQFEQAADLARQLRGSKMFRGVD